MALLLHKDGPSGLKLGFLDPEGRWSWGAHERSRTADLILTKDVLYQLSYMGEIKVFLIIGSERAGDEGRTRGIQLGRLTLYQLSYSRGEWMGKDSNLRSGDAADLQSAPFGQLGHPSGRIVVKVKWPKGLAGLARGRRESWRWDLNPQPPDYKSGALPLSYASEIAGSLLVEVGKPGAVRDKWMGKRAQDLGRPKSGGAV
jgi:hypothetical protein